MAPSKDGNVLTKVVSGIFGAAFLLLATPFVLTGTARFPIIGLGIGLIFGFMGIAPFVSGEGTSDNPLGLTIISILLLIISLLCIAGFICSFKPQLFEGRHGNEPARNDPE